QCSPTFENRRFGSPVARRRFGSPNFRRRFPSPQHWDYDETRCTICDSTSHDRFQCQYPDPFCTFCQIPGHIEQACRRKKQKNVSYGQRHYSQGQVHQMQQLESVSPMCQEPHKSASESPVSATLPNVKDKRFYKPIKMLAVNGIPLVFELDTGSPITILTEDTW